MNRTFTPNPNQLAVMHALHEGVVGAQDIAKAPGVKVGPTAVYNTLRALKSRGVVLEKKVHAGTTPKGDRYEYRLSAKGRKAHARTSF